MSDKTPYGDWTNFVAGTEIRWAALLTALVGSWLFAFAENVIILIESAAAILQQPLAAAGIAYETLVLTTFVELRAGVRASWMEVSTLTDVLGPFAFAAAVALIMASLYLALVALEVAR